MKTITSEKILNILREGGVSLPKYIKELTLTISVSEVPTISMTYFPSQKDVNTNKEHNWVYDGVSPHNGEYWYKCTRCGASDWIASYGTIDQLMPKECPGDIQTTK